MFLCMPNTQYTTRICDGLNATFISGCNENVLGTAKTWPILCNEGLSTLCTLQYRGRGCCLVVLVSGHHGVNPLN